MNLRSTLFGFCMVYVCALSACGTAPSDADEQHDAVLSRPVPVALRLTTIKMNGHSVNPANSVTAYVTLPGMTTTSTYIGDYVGPTVTNTNNQFNCSSLHVLPGSDGYCTAKLPLYSTVGPTKFFGSYPANTSSVPASVRINGTTTNFTINSNGTPSQTCATTWMFNNNSIDGDKITICWQVSLAIPFQTGPMLQTVFYPAPGDKSSVGLQQMNTLATKQDWSYQTGSSSAGILNINFDDFADEEEGTGDFGNFPSIGGGLTFNSSSTVGNSLTVSTGSATSFTYNSSSVLPDSDDNLYLIIAKANATWLNLNDGTKPRVDIDLNSGHFWAVTMRQMKGLAQNPQDATSFDPGDQDVVKQDIDLTSAREFIAQDPFTSGQPITQVLAANPKRFIPAKPAKVSLVAPTNLTPTTQIITGSETDAYIGQSTGDMFQFNIGVLQFGATDTTTYTVTYENMNQSTSSITLGTANQCLEGTADLYMDTKFGTIIPVPHMEDSCNAPTNNCLNGPATSHTLKPGQSLSRGQTLTSCNGTWTLTLQQDGTLAEFYNDHVNAPQLVTSFYPPGATTATMQTNGDFVLKDAAGNVLSDSGTSSTAGAFFTLQNDGFLAIYNPLATPEGGVGGALPAIWTLAPGG